MHEILRLPYVRSGYFCNHTSCVTFTNRISYLDFYRPDKSSKKLLFIKTKQADNIIVAAGQIKFVGTLLDHVKLLRI